MLGDEGPNLNLSALGPGVQWLLARELRRHSGDMSTGLGALTRCPGGSWAQQALLPWEALEGGGTGVLVSQFPVSGQHRVKV